MHQLHHPLIIFYRLSQYELHDEKITLDNSNTHYNLKTIAMGIVIILERIADLLLKTLRMDFPHHLTMLYFVNNGGLFFYHTKVCIILISSLDQFQPPYQWTENTIYHPVVRLRELAQWAVLHLCMRILTPGLFVMV